MFIFVKKITSDMLASEKKIDWVNISRHLCRINLVLQSLITLNNIKYLKKHLARF